MAAKTTVARMAGVAEVVEAAVAAVGEGWRKWRRRRRRADSKNGPVREQSKRRKTEFDHPVDFRRHGGGAMYPNPIICKVAGGVAEGGLAVWRCGGD